MTVNITTMKRLHRLAKSLILIVGLIFPSFNYAQENPVAKPLLTFLDLTASSEKILTIASECSVYSKGILDNKTAMTASIPMSGIEDRVAITHDPIIKFNKGGDTQSMIKGIFNGKYWTHAISRTGTAGTDNFFNLNVLRISEKPNPLFVTYKRRTALELFSPFFRFSDRNITISIRDLLLGRGLYTFSLTEVTKNGTKLIKINYGGDNEWLLIDPQKNFLILEHVIKESTWSNETTADELLQNKDGLWYPARYTNRYVRDGKEQLRYETKVVEVKFEDKNSFEQKLKQKYAPGWRVVDERINKEFTIGDSPTTIINNIQNHIK